MAFIYMEKIEITETVKNHEVMFVCFILYKPSELPSHISIKHIYLYHFLGHSGTEKNRMHVLIASFLWGLRMLHPLMPHLSEVLWQSLFNDGKSILQQPYPKVNLLHLFLPKSYTHNVQ